ncbi:MAG: glycosyltransferase family A protein [Candidatus Bathyarchaeia archaeon]|nr:glycosyltransferase family 2 protein [Candidatus Bathyarchaeota archaeon]
MDVWGSIVIPTTINEGPIPTLNYLSECELRCNGVEVIVVRDRWGNANIARNIGIAAAHGQVICVIDDDVKLSQEKLLKLMREVLANDGLFYLSLEPHVIIVKSDDIIKAGGYDERYKPAYGEDVELMNKLTRNGLRKIFISQDMLDLTHLCFPRNRSKRYLWNQKHLTWNYIRYGGVPLHKLVLRKNPLEVARRIKWILEWIFYQRWKRRSIFC